MELKVGKWYVIAARGPMLLGRRAKPPKTLTYTFVTLEGKNYWAAKQQIMGPVTREFLATYERESKARNLWTPEHEVIWDWLGGR